MIFIRKANEGDIEGIVDVNIRTWQSAYKGIINDSTLNSLNSNREQRIERSRQGFGKTTIEGRIIQQVVASKDNEVVGFVSFGACREVLDFCIENVGEVYAIYVLENYQGEGIGRKLIHSAAKHLSEVEEFEKMVIWTLKENHSRGFYEYLGGTPRFEKVIDIGGQLLDEVGYLYDSIADLKDRTR